MEAESLNRLGSGSAVASAVLEGFLYSVVAGTVTAAGEAVVLLLLAVVCHSRLEAFEKGASLESQAEYVLVRLNGLSDGKELLPFLHQMMGSSASVISVVEEKNVDERYIMPILGRSKNRVTAENIDDGETDEEEEDDDDGDYKDEDASEDDNENEVDDDDLEANGGRGSEEDDDGEEEEDDGDGDGDEDEDDEEEDEEEDDEDEEEEEQPPLKRRK